MGTVTTLSDGEPDRPPIDRHQFAAYLVMRELSDNTIRNYSAMFMRWCDWAIANGADPYRPGPLEVRAWGKTIQGERSLLAHARATMHHLCDALGVDDVSPAIYLPRSGKRVHRGLDLERAVQLHRTAVGAGLKGLAVLVALYTAARRGEVASLSWRRIDLNAQTLTLQRDKTRDLHTIPLHPVLWEHLEPRRVPGDWWVFPGNHGGHVSPDTIGRWVEEVCEDAGIGHVTSHQLRHTALTMVYTATKDIRATQELAGHTKLETTVRYTEVQQERLAKAVKQLLYGRPDVDVPGPEVGS